MKFKNKKELIERLKSSVLFFDGAIGTFLQKEGILDGCPWKLNLINPKLVQNLHKIYADAGADIITTHTFGANRLKLKDYKLSNKVKQINQAAVKNARKAAPNCIIAGEIGPIGKYIEPLDSITFDKAYKIYQEQVKALKGVDILIIATIVDIKIMRAALIAAKESGKTVITSMTFDGLRTATGTDVKTYTKIVDSLGADIIGANCSAGPKELYGVAKIICKNTNKPVIIQPNAGLPRLVNGETVFDTTAEEFAKWGPKFVKLGVNILGGCCGTNQEFIKLLIKKTKKLEPLKKKNKIKTSLCSRTKTIELGNKTFIIGERINPTGREDLRESIKSAKISVIRKDALKQKEDGASLLDINMGVPGTDEINNLKNAVEIVQNTVDLPIVIDTSNKKALEEALKKCDGKPLINSVNGHPDSIKDILSLAKKYGAAVIALCLDEKGIPSSVKGRIEIAKKIIKAAEKLGIPKEDVIVDSLVMTIATNPENEDIILKAVKDIKRLGFKTILGVSNISHGLPNRSEINQKFFTKTVKAGLDLALLNPKDNILRKNTDISLRIKKEKIDYDKLDTKKKLFQAIIHGDKENILSLVNDSLKELDAYQINDILICGLEEVGKKFNTKEFFLPNILQSASTMKIAFNRLKKEIKKTEKKEKAKIIFATVEHDIHDIGKNIVISILESHGYKIIDLGIDVPLKKIINKVVKEKADLIALSALMTTTAPEMEKIIKELKKESIKIPVIIGGAVITKDYAKSIDAVYSRDALSSVKVIKKILEKKR